MTLNRDESVITTTLNNGFSKHEALRTVRVSLSFSDCPDQGTLDFPDPVG